MRIRKNAHSISYSSPNTNPIAPAATASAAIANPVSTTAPPVVTSVGQSIEDVLIGIVEDRLDVIVEFIVILELLVIVVLDIETESDIELVAGGRFVVELPVLVEEGISTVAEGEEVSAAPASVPQYVDAKAARAACGR